MRAAPLRPGSCCLGGKTGHHRASCGSYDAKLSSGPVSFRQSHPTPQSRASIREPTPRALLPRPPPSAAHLWESAGARWGTCGATVLGASRCSSPSVSPQVSGPSPGWL